MKIVITGGAGFIGSNLARRLVSEGLDVTVLDNFLPQVHGTNLALAEDLAGRVQLIRGDVRDRGLVLSALRGADAVVHLAAETGTGQSMYEIARYADVNIQGTALLMDILTNEKSLSVSKVVVASSRAIYGEGAYVCQGHGPVFPGARTGESLARGAFEPVCPICGDPCVSIPTSEDSRLSPTSFYGLTKQVQEQMVLMMSRAIGINAVALRYQNVFGPGQSLRNPYTGILAIFSGLARTNQEIRIFEDGKESRDFVYIDDVVEATRRALDPDVVGTQALNVGTGVGVPVLEVAERIRSYFGCVTPVRITGESREGDIRHNVADLARSRDVLGFRAKVSFPEGLTRFLDWANENEFDVSGYQRSLAELQALNLMKG